MLINYSKELAGTIITEKVSDGVMVFRSSDPTFNHMTVTYPFRNISEFNFNDVYRDIKLKCAIADLLKQPDRLRLFESTGLMYAGRYFPYVELISSALKESYLITSNHAVTSYRESIFNIKQIEDCFPTEVIWSYNLTDITERNNIKKTDYKIIFIDEDEDVYGFLCHNLKNKICRKIECKFLILMNRFMGLDEYIFYHRLCMSHDATMKIDWDVNDVTIFDVSFNQRGE